MDESAKAKTRFHDADEADVVAYRAVSGLALAGLALGLLSPVALAALVLWIVPILGVAASAVALWRISRGATLTGRKAALAGLVLSLVFLVAAPVDWFGYRWLIRREARHVAEEWFAALAENRPQVAYELTRPMAMRSVPETMDKYFEPASEARQRLARYTEEPEIRALLLLGPAAEVRYYDTEAQWADNERDGLMHVYAVTFTNRQGEKETFFIDLVLEHVRHPNTGTAYWHLYRTAAGVHPSALGGGAASRDAMGG